MSFIKTTTLMFLFATLSLFGGNSIKLPKSKPIAVISQNESLIKNCYIAIAYSYYKHKNLTIYEKLNANALSFTLGYEFNNYFAIELRYLKSKNIDYKSLTQNKKIRSKFSNLSLFSKITYPIREFKPYILIGYGKNKITNLANYDRVEYSFEYGGGFEYKINQKVSLFTDYTRVYNKRGFDGRAKQDKQKINLITTGLIYRF